MNDHLRIAVCIEEVATALEFAPQFRKVVDLAVEYNPDRLVFVVNRLTPTRQVNDA
jgi:hypothetical protein